MQQPALAETSWQPLTLAWPPFSPSAPEAPPVPSPPAPVETTLQGSRTLLDESPLELPSGHFVSFACGVCANLTHGHGIEHHGGLRGHKVQKSPGLMVKFGELADTCVSWITWYAGKLG